MIVEYNLECYSYKKKRTKMKLTDNEKRDIVKLLEEGKDLPEKYRFLLFESEISIKI